MLGDLIRVVVWVLSLEMFDLFDEHGVFDIQ